MDALTSRINGQPDYRPAVQQNRSAWREEMLDQLLSQMRDRKLSQETLIPAGENAALPGKGSFIDIYV